MYWDCSNILALSIVVDSCVVEPRDEHYNTQNLEENACSTKKTEAKAQQEGTSSCIVATILDGT